MNIPHADAEYLTRIATVKDESAASASVAVWFPALNKHTRFDIDTSPHPHIFKDVHNAGC